MPKDTTKLSYIEFRERERAKRAAEVIDRQLNPELYEHTSKECIKCHKEKLLKDYPPTNNTCRNCLADITRGNRIADPAHTSWKAAKTRSGRSGIPFEITLEDVKAVWTDTCPVLGIPLKTNTSRAGPDSHSLDRIDNTKGYVPGNIAIVSNHLNLLKRDLTPELVRRMLAYMEGRLLP